MEIIYSFLVDEIDEIWISGKKISSGYEQNFKGVIPNSSPLWKPDNDFYGMDGECSYIEDDFFLKTWTCDASSYAICQMKPKPGMKEQIFD